VRSASAVQVREPIYRDSVGRWRAYAGMSGPLLEVMGLDASGRMTKKAGA
jgi:hypothetical protein